MSSTAIKLEVLYSMKKVFNTLKEETLAKETFASWKSCEIWKINFYELRQYKWCLSYLDWMEHIEDIRFGNIYKSLQHKCLKIQQFCKVLVRVSFLEKTCTTSK